MFVLAAAGVLDGKTATTDWRYADKLKLRYPSVRVQPDTLYVDEGRIVTAAGSAAGLDMLLHLVRRDHGGAVANRVAQRLVVAPHRHDEPGRLSTAIRTRESEGMKPLR